MNSTFFLRSDEQTLVCKIMRFLKFNMRSTRLSQYQTDRFALIFAD